MTYDNPDYLQPRKERKPPSNFEVLLKYEEGKTNWAIGPVFCTKGKGCKAPLSQRQS